MDTIAKDSVANGTEQPTGAQRADEEFEKHVRPRRAAAQVSGDPDGTWGIALSGGGVRSATLCLGVIRGLAKNGLLREFDYLSTVSGGGYIGASLGRLFGPTHSALDVEQGVAKDNSMWLWWLRNNGRYLTPAGAKDLGYATASIMRGIIATHLEMGILILLLAAAVLLPHLLVSLLPPLAEGSWRSLPFVGVLQSMWWWMLPLPLFALIHQLLAYWYTRDRTSLTSLLFVAAGAAGGIVLAGLFWSRGEAAFARYIPEGSGATSYLLLYYVAAFLALAPATACITALWDAARGRSVAELRLNHTKRLAYALWAVGIFIALGLLDWATWQLTGWFWTADDRPLKLKITAALAVLIAGGRLLLPEIQRRLASSKRPNVNIEKVLNLVGISLALLVAVLWTSLLSIVLYPRELRTTAVTAYATLSDVPQLQWWGAAVLVCALYVLATRRSFDLLNLASLHNFYRARIERAYVSSGNCQGPRPRFRTSALHDVTPASTQHVAEITEAIEGDDVELTDYAPHQYGGPIHLINCCINQSVDDRTGIYNADRKGVALTVGSLGAETGTRFADVQTSGAVTSNANANADANAKGYATQPGKLSRWIAISGAAASTGMGSRTTPGFAALLFMSGLRLGYWTQALHRPDSPPRTSLRAWLVDWAPKPLAIVAESIARFPGLFSSLWYVSDGGHFDNTGIYALLKRSPRVIVAADCGADPKYLFADLESLVRKAKIDYGATIEFADAAKLANQATSDLACVLGTPETIGPEAGTRWLVLGRIGYCDGSEGALLIIKPRRLDRMPFDIVAYADRNPDFPQQSTGDQFFDEAQWEAYHQLGLMLGVRITRSLLEEALAAVKAMTHAPSSLSSAEAQARAQEPITDRRDRAALTVRASLGAGISLSLLLAVWQGIEQFRESRRAENKEYDTLYEALNDKVRDGKFAALLPDQFVAFAALSKARGDERFAQLRRRLNERCEELTPESKEKEACLQLYGKLTAEPKPFYDYWFADKLSNSAAQAQTARTAVVAPQASTTAASASATSATSKGAERGRSGGGAPPPGGRAPAGSVDELAISEGASSDVDESAGDEGSYAAARAGDVERVVDGDLSPLPSPALPSPAPAIPATTPMPTASVPMTSVPITSAPKASTAKKSASAFTACSATHARVFLHIYDEDSRDAAEQIARRLRAELGFRATPIENVVDTAKRRDRQPPYVWTTPALVVHPGNSQACIDAVKQQVAANTTVRKLPGRMTGNPGMVEVWLPPLSDATE